MTISSPEPAAHFQKVITPALNEMTESALPVFLQVQEPLSYPTFYFLFGGEDPTSKEDPQTWHKE